MIQEKFIQIRFKEQTVVGEFNDCLYFTEEEFAKLKQADIDTLATTRVNNWVTLVQSTPEPVEQTAEEIQKEIDEYTLKIEELTIIKANIISIKVK